MKPLIALGAALATALFLSSCTSPASDGHTDHDHGSAAAMTGPATTAAAAPNNAADVTFATGMIPHHEQAVQMSGLVPTRSADPAVITLAAEISAAQGPEIETMKGWLAQWNVSTADTGHDDHDATPGMQMQGMVDDATMTKLESLKGPEFDKLFLQSMIGHHEGAIAMANTELANGANPDAKVLAQQIVTAQQAEITQMKQMLGA
jgi:uncharacterized protein (DUF305 family)